MKILFDMSLIYVICVFTFSLLIYIQSIPKKDLQGFCFQDSQIALASYFSWQVEDGTHEIGNLVTLFLELTVNVENILIYQLFSQPCYKFGRQRPQTRPRLGTRLFYEYARILIMPDISIRFRQSD